MLAWHVVNEDFTLNFDLSDVEAYEGLELTYDGELEPCQSGLHASVCLLDALKYGNSGVICRVEVGENYIESDDKLVSDYRKVLYVKDCTKIIQKFAIYVAEDVLHIYENKRPNDMRPREAIEAAKQCLRGEIAAYDAADTAYAARAAARAADTARAADAADAAYAAAYAARAAAYAAAYAARAAARAADAADEKNNEYNTILEKMVLEYMRGD